MAASSQLHKPKYPLPVAALALSTVGLLVFFMPVLGIPLASLGLVFAIVAFGAAFWGRAADVRWAVIAVVFSLLVLAIDILIGYGPDITSPHRIGSGLPEPAPIPYVSPPEELPGTLQVSPGSDRPSD